MKFSMQIDTTSSSRYHAERVLDRLKLLEFLLTDRLEEEAFEKLQVILPMRDIYRILDQAIDSASNLLNSDNN